MRKKILLGLLAVATAFGQAAAGPNDGWDEKSVQEKNKLRIAALMDVLRSEKSFASQTCGELVDEIKRNNKDNPQVQGYANEIKKRCDGNDRLVDTAIALVETGMANDLKSAAEQKRAIAAVEAGVANDLKPAAGQKQEVAK
jgi:hypothetical protein